MLQGVTCIPLNAASPGALDKELAEPNFKGLAITPCWGTAITPASR